jgi:hypothetical protein
MPTLEYAMTVKERLHHLVDALPESEAPTATRILEALVATADPVLRAHLLAPEDDESTAGDDADGDSRKHVPSLAYRMRKPDADCSAPDELSARMEAAGA